MLHRSQCGNPGERRKLNFCLEGGAVLLFRHDMLSYIHLFAVPWTIACQVSLSFTMSWSFLKLIPIESVMPSNYLILCHPFLLLPSIFPSIKVFSRESTFCFKWTKYWSFSFSFSISPSNEYSGKIIVLTTQTFVNKVMSLLFNTLSRFVIALLPRSKFFNFMATVTHCLQWLRSPRTVCHCFHFFPIYLPWNDETGCHDLSFLNIEF